MLAYRLWMRPSGDLPFKELDDLPDHRLWKALSAYGRQYVIKAFGSEEGWYKQRALDRIARLQQEVALANSRRRVPATMSSSIRVPTLEDAITDERNDKRHFIDQLLHTTDAIESRSPEEKAREMSNWHRRHFEDWVQNCRLTFVMPFDSEPLAREVAHYLTRRRELGAWGQHDDTWTRFGVIRVADLDTDGRIRLVEDMRQPDKMGLVERAQVAIEVLRDAGVIDDVDVPSISDHSPEAASKGTPSPCASSRASSSAGSRASTPSASSKDAGPPHGDSPRAGSSTDAGVGATPGGVPAAKSERTEGHVNTGVSDRDRERLAKRGLFGPQLTYVEAALTHIRSLRRSVITNQDLDKAGIARQTLNKYLAEERGSGKLSPTGKAVKYEIAAVEEFLLDECSPDLDVEGRPSKRKRQRKGKRKSKAASRSNRGNRGNRGSDSNHGSG
jgi:hypothetical protein